MSSNDAAALAGALLLALLLLLVAVGLYLWYAVALSRLFPRLGAEGWKGWVPLLNEMVILERGGVPGWSVVFLFIPVINVYGLYLRVLAMHRIGRGFGRGGGMLLLGIVLPPLWASLVCAGAPEPAEDYGQRIRGMMAGVPSPPPAAPSPPPVAAALSPFAPPQPQMPQMPPVPADPWAPRPPAAPPAPLPPESAVDFSSVADLPTIVPSRRGAAPFAAGEEDDDEFDRTSIVSRRPLVRWSLVTDGGEVVPITSDAVLLGRKPLSRDAGVTAVVVPDATRTLSKSHARLDLREGVWTVTDLDSTNGVVVVEPDGTETLLPAGGSARVLGRFVLGKVGMRLVFEDGPPA